MLKRLLLIIVLLGLAFAVYSLISSEDAAPEGEHHEKGGERAHITDDSARMMGIETVIAGPATIRETKSLSGRVVLNQNASAEVKARYAGIVRKVFKQAGETVKRGEKLATVESNESLQTYAVTSPLDGVVLERTISVGDEAGEEPVFVVADLSKLWAEFFVFAGDIGQIAQGQPVTVATLDNTLTSESTLFAVLPTADSASQTVTARAELDNTSGTWRSGMSVRGDVTLSQREVALAVPTVAIQRLEGNPVVFVKQGEEYIAVPITLGAADRVTTEVTEGLQSGAEVVSKNSFVVKADIGKAGAEHED